MPKIERMFAFVSQSPEGEGLIAVQQVVNGQLMMMPLVGADMDRVKSLYPLAEQVCKAKNVSFRIYSFENRVDITQEVDPLRV